MKLIGIKRKSDGELIMVVPQGKSYKLPGGLTRDAITLTTVYIPEVGDPVNISLSPEQIAEMEKKREEENKHLQQIADEQGIGVGDVIAKLTKAFGIKPCASCEQRRKVANKLRIKGWKIKWVKGEPDIGS